MEGSPVACGIAATIITATFLVGKRRGWCTASRCCAHHRALGGLVDAGQTCDLGIKDMGRLLPGHGGLIIGSIWHTAFAVAAWIVSLPP